MSGERILLVEDGADVRQFLADCILRPAGYDVLTAVDGAEGFVLASDLRPDLIIADYLMPNRTGLEMLSDLRDVSITLPFILITAEGSEELAVRALRLGVSDYLIKPFDPDDFLAAVERVLREHWTRQITQQIPSQLLEANRQLEQRLRELDTLVEIGKRVAALLDLQAILNQVVSAAVSVSHAEEGTLLLVDSSTRELYLYASTEELGRSFRLPVSDSLAGYVVQTRKPLVIAGEEPQKIKTHYLARDLIYVPMIVQDEVIGVLGVNNRETSGEFAPHTLQLLSVLADFAAIAIANARFYATMQYERDTLDTIMHDTDEAIIVVDHHERILFFNPAACEAFALPDENYQGKSLTQVIHHDRLVNLFHKACRAGQSCTGEIVLNEGKRTMHAQLSVIERVGKVAVLQDITHLKDLDRIKSDFVTSVSHDLRSPLTSILGYVELVSRSGPLNDSQKQFASRIVSSVKSITLLITDLLELGKIEAGFDRDLEPIPLGPIVAEALEEHRIQWETKRQSVQARLIDSLPAVLGNPQRLRQMVNNLLENAIKYTPPGGRIQVLLDGKDGFLVLRVSDTGIGIPKQDQPYIFDKFFRSDLAIDEYDGTGLGLSIVKGIVDQHHGRIWVESQEGRGSVFTVMLPSTMSSG